MIPGPTSPQPSPKGEGAGGGEAEGIGWMIDVEIALARQFGWSLFDIDRTDVGSLIPFVMRLTKGFEEKSNGKKVKKVFVDQLDL